MRYKKIVSGLLACAVAVTSIFAGNVNTVKAEGEQPMAEGEVTPFVTYDFNSKTLKEGVEVLKKGGSAYEGTVTDADYGAGKSGEAGDNAINLGGKFGLKLPEKNIGSKYTVSMWVKRTGDMTNFMPIMFLGRPENGQWIGIAGAYGNPNGCILWGGDNANSIPSANEASFALQKDVWTMLTVTQDENDVRIYKDGELIKKITMKLKTLDGEEQAVYLGVNAWDDVFPGLIDNVSIYKQALTEDQVFQEFDDRTDEQILADGEITADAELPMVQGTSKRFKVTLPKGLTPDKVTFSYTSDKPSIAEVEQATGMVKAKAVGTAVITTTVTCGQTSKTATTNVTVRSNEGINTEVAAEYEFVSADNGKLADKSGHGNDATIKDTSCVAFTPAQGDEEGYATFSGEAKKGYIELPSSIMNDLTDQEKFTIETRFAKAEKCGNNAWLYCFGSISKGTGTNYMFFSPNFGGKTLRAGIKDNGTEKLFGTSIEPVVDDWYTVHMVFNEGVLKLYLNGVLIKGDDGYEINSGYSIMKDVVTPGTQNGVLGFIGKSCWSADDNYKGKISRFKIYDKAMTDEDVQLSDPAFLEAFQANLEDMEFTSFLGENGSANEVKYNLSLPAIFNEVNVSWKSLTPQFVTDAGEIKGVTKNETAIIEATITSGALSASKSFEFTVVPSDRTELDALLPEAQNRVNDIYMSEASRNYLKAVLDKALKAENQTQINSVVKNLKKALEKVDADLNEYYKDPFSKVDESKFKNNISLIVGESSDALTQVIPADIKDFVTVKYESKDAQVASVNAAGRVTAGTKLGYTVITTTITAKYDQFAMEYQTLVRVDLSLSQVSASAKATSLAKGKTTTVDVSYPAAVRNLNPAVSYTAKGAVSVNQAGKITAKKAGTGTVYVKVKAGGMNVTRKVTVNVGDITGASKVKVKKSITLKVKGVSGKVKWSVNKKSLAKISSKGKLTAKKAGKVKVTAKVGNVTMTKTITIQKSAAKKSSKKK